MFRRSAVLSVLLAAGGSLGSAEAATPAFTDVTTTAGIDAEYDAGPYEYTGGGTTGDFNRDGFQDLFLLGGGYGGRPDFLYINNGDGTFTDQGQAWGLNDTYAAQGVAVGDFNNDGWLDIYVTSHGAVGSFGPCQNRLYRNNGGESFTNVASAAGVDCTGNATANGGGTTFGDYDLDGDLDLFVASFEQANQGTRLFRNNGDDTFTDATQAAMFFDLPFHVSGFSPRFMDMDGDRYPEMLLVGDFGTSRYYRNNADGTFTDLTVASGTGLDKDGMGQTVGDFDGNLKPDWYVTAIYIHLVPAAPGNKLYLNLGQHQYAEVAQSAGVNKGGYGWGTVAVDFNHDMLLDLAETNGEPSANLDEQTKLWINDGDGTFTEMAIASGFVHYGQGRGMVNFDYDNDGDQDVAILAYNEEVRLFRNDVGGQNSHWLRVLLDTSAVAGLAPDGIGSRVLATMGGLPQVRHICSGDNFLSHSELSAHFGGGGAATATALRVEWPNGAVTMLSDLATNQTVTLLAPGPVSCAPAPPEVTGLRLERVNGGQDIVFNWNDVPGADDYRVLADSSSRGGFPLVMGTATSGAVGLVAPTPPGTKFFLVAARTEGCWGPK